MDLDLFDAVIYEIEKQIVLELGDCFWQKQSPYANNNPDEKTIDMWIRNWASRTGDAQSSINGNRLWDLLVKKQAEVNRLQQQLIELEHGENI